MSGKIRKEDIEDLDVVDSDELSSDGASSFKTGVTVVSTTSGTKRVVISGFDLDDRDTPVEAGDLVTLAGTSGGGAADGTFTVNSIIDSVTFDVVESISTSTGGSASFAYPPGASRVGFDSTGLTSTSATNVQDALRDHDVAISTGGSNVGGNTDFLLENDPPEPNVNYAITRSSGQVSKEEWTRNPGNLLKSIDYSRTGNVIDIVVVKVFDTDGTTILGQTTETFTRSGGLVVSSTKTRDV